MDGRGAWRGSDGDADSRGFLRGISGDSGLPMRAAGAGLGGEEVDMEGRLEFREIRPGEYWPPVLPNGKFFAVPAGADQVMEILMVTNEGLRCGGVSYDWEDLHGVSIVGEQACLVSHKYISGGLKFVIATCRFEDERQRVHFNINGYPVEYCLMNRITFEQQMLADNTVSRSE